MPRHSADSRLPSLLILSYDDVSGIGGSFSTIREEYEYFKRKYPTFMMARRPRSGSAIARAQFTFSPPPVPTSYLRLLASLLILFLKLVRHVSSLRVYVLHAHDVYVGSVAAVVSRMFNVRLVLNVNGPAAYEFENFNAKRRAEFGFRETLLLALVTGLERFAYKAADAVIAISDFERRFVERVRRKAVYTVKNGINVDVFRPQKDKMELRKLIGLPVENTIVTYVGRMVTKNGVLIIAESISRVLKSRDDIVFVFVGDGFAENDCKRIVEEVGASQNVIFVGRKTNPAPFYQASDLFVSHVSSLVEGVGLTALEAIACGVPVIVGFDKLAYERLKNLAFFVPKDDPTGLARQILNVLATKNLEQVSRKLRKFAVTSLGWENTFRTYEKLLFQSGEV